MQQQLRQLQQKNEIVSVSFSKFKNCIFFSNRLCIAADEAAATTKEAGPSVDAANRNPLLGRNKSVRVIALHP